ncbi:MAG TPA: PPC domain-containing protein, partial [Azospirillaceae bacterium]|nr:PPC domain-containing protein [Azospirillaceae bacterium]
MPTLTNFRTTGDDFANTIHTSGAVAVGDSSTGIIDTSGDVDWFRVTLQGGQAYTVNLRGAPSGGGTLGDPLIPGVYDADGNALSGTDNDDSAASRDSQVTFTVETDGTYFLAAGAYGSNAGTYTLELAAGEGEGAGNAGDDFSDNVRTLGTVAAGGSATGTIEQDGDADWFRVMLQAGQAYTISLRGAVSSAGTLADPMIGGVYDAEGQLIVDTTNDDTSGRDSQVVLTPTTSGAYYIAAGAYGSYTGTYTLGVMANTDDYTATTATTGLVEVDGSATGSIESARDIDWFRVTLQGGRIYRILQEGAPNGNGSLPDTHIRGIYRATGQLIANTANDDAMGTQNSEVQFRAPGTGTAVYYIAVGAYGQGIGTYKVTVEPVTTSTDGDIADDISTAGRVTVGDSVSGSVDLPEDADWYRVTLAAGQSYQVSLRGAATGDGTLSDPQIAGIHDVEGQLIEGTINDDAGGSRNAEVIFTPSEDGTYFIAARGYWYETGSYTLEVKPTEAETGHADTVSATTATTGVITVGRAQTSTIEEAGDIDWFRVSLSRGTTYTVTLNGAAGTGSALADPFFRGVHDAGGNMLADTANDDGASSSRDSRVTFTAPANGTYFLAAGAYGGGTGGYQLNITRRAAPTDDYANTVAAGGRYGQLTVGRSTTGTIGAAADIDLFGVTLQAGRTYAINLEGAATGQGTLDNPAIQAIYNAAGRSVRARTNVDTDGSANETLMFLP